MKPGQWSGDPPPRQAALIINTGSRSGKRQFREARRLLRSHDINLVSARGVAGADQFSNAVRDAAEAKVPLIIVGGGDGSLLSAVPHLSGKDDVVLGILPLGTANSFARALELPLALDEAVRVLASGRVRRVDLAEIDGHLYAGCASIGLAPKIAETVPRGLKAWAGRPGYLIWAMAQLASFHAFELTIGSGGETETLRAVEVRIANGPYHGGVELVDRADLSSGRIVVQAVIGQTRRDLIFNWLAHLSGSEARRRTTREFDGQEISISTSPLLPISIDGEVLAQTPVTARVRQNALLVVAPAA